MKKFKKILMGLFAAGFIFITPQVTFADNVDDLQQVPENIYTWIDSTDRGNYYFNHQQINYDVDEDGFIDLDVLIVPTICTYDEIQIQDVVSKRRWNGKSTKGYNNLVGRADYLRFDLIEGTVQVTERVDLDNKWGTLDTDKSGQPINLSDLSSNSVECKIYRKILTWAKRHNEEIIKHSWGKLRPEDKELKQKEMPLMKLDLP